MEKLVVHVVLTKVVESVVEVITQLVESIIVPLKYPCIICSSSKHHAPDCPRKTKV
jgi:hypothetical protein